MHQKLPTKAHQIHIESRVTFNKHFKITMHLDFKELSSGQTYFTMIQTIIPRPIAWVLSENSSGSFNLAPFSYFTAVSSDPALLMFSIGKKNSNENKDTLENIRLRNQFVVHIADTSLSKELNQSAALLPYGKSEVDSIGLQTVDFENFSLPRLDKAKVAFACSLYEVKQIGNQPMSLVFGEVHQAFIHDDIIQYNGERIKVDAQKLDPLARLGGNDYSAIAEPFTLERPK